MSREVPGVLCNSNIPQVDRVFGRCYSTHMMQEPVKTRKKRSDRLHIVYMLVVRGERYVGVTVKSESTVLKSVTARFNKHWYRAHTENKNWRLCEALRTISDRSEVEIKVLAIVRGKAAGHAQEVSLRRELNPELNTDCR